MGSWKLIDHTADVGIRIEAETLEDLFIVAGEGMIAVVFDDIPDGWPESHRIELTAPDAESLLVDWLSELLYLFEVKRFVFREAAFEKFRNGELKAEVRGIKYSGSIAGTEIKAVTHHLLEIVKIDTLFSTEIYFDL